MRCTHCDTRVPESPEFAYCGHPLCCECMSALCSWFLEGGFREDPEMFAYLLEQPVEEVGAR